MPHRPFHNQLYTGVHTPGLDRLVCDKHGIPPSHLWKYEVDLPQGKRICDNAGKTETPSAKGMVAQEDQSYRVKFRTSQKTAMEKMI